MNTTCDNQETLFKQLSLRGDPTAFFSLCSGYFKERYLRERKNGVAHDDAQNRVVSEATTLLEELQRVKPDQFDAWFEEHCTLLPASSSDVDFEKEDISLSSDVETCLTFCSRALLRTGSEIAKNKNRRSRRFTGRIFQHTVGKIAVIFLVIAGIFLLATILMVQFDTSINVSVISSTDTLSFQYPLPEKSEKDSIYFLSPISRDSINTLTEDTTVAGKDTVVAASPPKKSVPITPKRKPRVPKLASEVGKPKSVKTYPREAIERIPAPSVPPVQEPVVSPPPSSPPTSSPAAPQPSVEPVGSDDVPSYETEEEAPAVEPVAPEPVSPSSDIPDLM